MAVAAVATLVNNMAINHIKDIVHIVTEVVMVVAKIAIIRTKAIKFAKVTILARIMFRVVFIDSTLELSSSIRNIAIIIKVRNFASTFIIPTTFFQLGLLLTYLSIIILQFPCLQQILLWLSKILQKLIFLESQQGALASVTTPSMVIQVLWASLQHTRNQLQIIFIFLLFLNNHLQSAMNGNFLHLSVQARVVFCFKPSYRHS